MDLRITVPNKYSSTTTQGKQSFSQQHNMQNPRQKFVNQIDYYNRFQNPHSDEKNNNHNRNKIQFENAPSNHSHPSYYAKPIQTNLPANRPNKQQSFRRGYIENEEERARFLANPPPSALRAQRPNRPLPSSNTLLVPDNSPCFRSNSNHFSTPNRFHGHPNQQTMSVYHHNPHKRYHNGHHFSNGNRGYFKSPSVSSKPECHVQSNVNSNAIPQNRRFASRPVYRSQMPEFTTTTGVHLQPKSNQARNYNGSSGHHHHHHHHHQLYSNPDPLISNDHPPHQSSTDEYIDDFAPEDLAKYTLEINGEDPSDSNHKSGSLSEPERDFELFNQKLTCHERAKSFLTLGVDFGEELVTYPECDTVYHHRLANNTSATTTTTTTVTGNMLLHAPPPRYLSESCLANLTIDHPITIDELIDSTNCHVNQSDTVNLINSSSSSHGNINNHNNSNSNNNDSYTQETDLSRPVIRSFASDSILVNPHITNQSSNDLSNSNNNNNNNSSSNNNSGDRIYHLIHNRCWPKSETNLSDPLVNQSKQTDLDILQQTHVSHATEEEEGI